MRVALLQLATRVGDFAGNARAIRDGIAAARSAGAEVALLPELAVCGYPPLDLLLEHGFVDENLRALHGEIAPSVRAIVAVIGFVDRDPCARLPGGGPVLRNAAAVVEDGRVRGVTHKTLLPEYDVFFERRYFAPALRRTVHRTGAGPIGVLICEDLWDDAYDCKVARELARGGARALLSISASPFAVGKTEVRLEVARRRARDTGLPVAYVNQVGSEDGYEGQLVFDGSSFVVGADGRLIASARRFAPDLVVVNLDGPGVDEPAAGAPAEEIAPALVLGIREYARRCGFSGAVLGLSGGIDSAVVAALAVEALGRENVVALSLPTRHSSERGRRDADAVARNLGCELRVVSIEPMLRAVEAELRSTLAGPAGSVAHENVQARLRGLVLMAVSNREGRLLLTTGNKTELGLGYCTLYGDMNGGLAPLSDVGKLLVYELGRHVNQRAGREIVPESIFVAPPSPELRVDHRVPFDYSIVAPLVDEVVEHRRSRSELVARGYPGPIVDDCLVRIARAEYKRRQAPPGIKVTGRAFGVGRRLPLAHPFRSP